MATKRRSARRKFASEGRQLRQKQIGEPVRLERLSALAELVSSVAIVATLGYLAVQTHQNTLATQASVRQAMLAEDRELLLKTIDYPVVFPGLYDPKDLTRDQQAQLAAWTLLFFRVRENHWLQYEAGVIDAATWASYRTALRVILSSDYGRSSWRDYAARGDFDRGFVDDIEAYIAEFPPIPAIGVDQ